MNQRFRISAYGASFALLVFGMAVQSGVAARQHGRRIPYSRIAPILKTNCLNCHNAKNHPEGVDVTSYESFMKGSSHGPTVIPGFPAKSKLVAYLDGTKQPRMPLRKPPLSPGDQLVIKTWIALGAKKK